MVLKQKGDISLPQFFGLIHPLIGSDILCSPRNFGPAWILKACIDFSEILFDKDEGVQCLGRENATNYEVYIRFILALFKKKYVNKINSRKSVRWSAVPVPCLSRLCLRLRGEQGSGPEGVDDLCFHTYGEFSPSSPPSPPGIGSLGWNLDLEAEIWASRLGFEGGRDGGGGGGEEGENPPYV